MNLEVRVGKEPVGESNKGDQRLGSNTRCGIFHGPTLVSKQWVEIDCGYTKGIKGNRVTIQLLERKMKNNPLEISSIEVFGWAPTC